MKKISVILSLLVFGASVQGQFLISEFEPNPPGGDPATVQIELSGAPGALFTGWVVSIESDISSSFGTVDRAADFTGNTTVFDGNGLLTLSMPDLENPSFTVALVSSFSGTAGVTSIETGGAPDLSSFGTIYDAIGVPDTDGEPLYGVAMGGVDLPFIGSEPSIVFRGSSTGDFYMIDGTGTELFDPAGGSLGATILTTTFGSINAVPEPSTYVAILGLMALAFVAIRRRRK